ncbi:putative two-component sensor kinase [Paenibacillus sp. J31TS4]|uniref:sensor histidine kinase n=1 Tax=Paenibacillus sp. J31TS4 TaxID=2807195 RepID=UPI001B1B7275|nr:sensor histidine kinase [Paenibacillus sp. J31TS4]GIP40166.1 putative two-component sensor kinase [Paenibacillus sp. J31TS4]
MRRLAGYLNSIRNRIFVSILLFLVIPFLLANHFLDKPMESAIERRIGSSAQDALVMMTFNVQLFFEDMLNSAVNISINPDMKKLLRTPEALTHYEKLRLNDQYLNRSFSPYFSNTYVTLFDREGNWQSTRYLEENLYRQYISSPWYVSMLQTPFQNKWMFNDKPFLYTDRKTVLTLVKSITDLPTNENIGLIVFSVAESDLRKYLTGLEGELYLVDKDGTIVSSPNASLIGTSIAKESYMPKLWTQHSGQVILDQDGHKSIVNFDTVDANGWKLVQKVPYDTIFKEIFDLNKTKAVIVVFIFIVFTIITLSISYGMSRPLKLLRKRMQVLERKDFHAELPVTGPEEISSLIVTYNRMVKQIRQLLQRLKEEYQQKEDMRFRALQAQIDPHFILNTLNNIKWMAYIRSDREVGDMLSNLGGILEQSIGRGGTLLPLRREIEYIENYAALMKMKFNERLTLEIDIPEEYRDQEVIKIMLQPIIENSLMHGIEPSSGPGRIVVTAEHKEGRFVLTVQDNGVGIPPDKLEELRGRLAARSNEPLERIGIQNVHDRIRLQYGDEYGLAIYSGVNEGTTVRITLPIKKMQEGMGADDVKSDAGR